MTSALEKQTFPMENSEIARRKYWQTQMDAAYDFMNQMLEYPVNECGENLVFLPDAAKANGVVIQFANTKIADKHKRLFYLRSGLVDDFIQIAKDMNNRGWILRVEDAFRSRAMQTDIALQKCTFDKILEKVKWEVESQSIPEASLMLKRLTALIAICPKIGTHMSGSALDISIREMDKDTELERGGPYLELSELTPMSSPFISAKASQNRTEITEIMLLHGFIAYPYEFWHYSKGDAYAEYLTNSAKPARYGAIDFNLLDATSVPIANPQVPLHSIANIEEYMLI